MADHAPFRSWPIRAAVRTFQILVLGSTITAGLLLHSAYRSLATELPDISTLKSVTYEIPMRVYSRDGELIAVYGEKKTHPTPLENIPQPVIRAFLAAEDSRFFDHPGVDFVGLSRAAMAVWRHGEKTQGGSTITMQVARNFFLGREKTYQRKLKEILLSIRIERELSKRDILDLYLNKIYFGHHAYGVAAAAEVYFGKTLSELTLDETALLASLPKAPSAFNPIDNPRRAMIRRNYILDRMTSLGYVSLAEARVAKTKALPSALHTPEIELVAPGVGEWVRQILYARYGEEAYTKGYSVFTTVDSRLQRLAQDAVRHGLHAYDERHGYRGSEHRIDLRRERGETAWDRLLATKTKVGATVPGLAITVSDVAAEVYLGGGQRVRITQDSFAWAGRYRSEESKGSAPRSVKQVIQPGDLVRLRPTKENQWVLAQVPAVEGALVALDSSNGAVLAVIGGYDELSSVYNRARAAPRQPGSGFKPVIYAAALESGYTPASVIDDAPVEFKDPASHGGVWRPQNYSGRFYGPTRLRVALAQSRNVVAVRLLDALGISKVSDWAERFGFLREELPTSLSMALGSGSASPLRMAQVYSVFANGGFRVEPRVIDRIEDIEGRAVFKAARAPGARVLSPEGHYLMNSMLQEVIRSGTASAAQALNRRDIAGKTGTTNDYKDVWFNGYVPGLVAVAWMGFDTPKPLGKEETGGHAALPMWQEFMAGALQNRPETGFPVPPGLVMAAIDPSTGRPINARGKSPLYEFLPRTRLEELSRQAEREAEQAGTKDEDLSIADQTDEEAAPTPEETGDAEADHAEDAAPDPAETLQID